MCDRHTDQVKDVKAESSFSSAVQDVSSKKFGWWTHVLSWDTRQMYVDFGDDEQQTM